ncbi:MAG TPA: thiolase family protein [Acidimicrobiia bacterium]|nr:thiolase family protein [Acidimicrobiia bacterium]
MTRAVGVRGVGTSSFGRFPDQRVESLAWEAIGEALQAAGAAAPDIDAVFVGTVFGPPGVGIRVLRGTGIGGVPVLHIEAACASGTAAFHEAVQAVAAGRYGTVLAFGVEHLSSLFPSGAIVPEATDADGAAGLPLPGLYALGAQRYMAVHGATPAQLAQVAVKNKAHGALNPRAHLGRQGPPALADVLGSKMIADPLTVLQCCPTTDGAAAAVIGPARPGDVTVRATALVSGMPWDQRHDEIWGVAPVQRAAERAFGAAGVDPADVDVLEVHDAFTIGEVVTLEALGLCKPGEGADLAPSGHTALGGRQPVNPSGGLLSRGHPLGATGLAQVAEITWQLQGRAAARQVAGARLGLVETLGGAASGMDGNAAVVALLESPG